MVTQEQSSDEWLNDIEPTALQLSQQDEEQYDILSDQFSYHDLSRPAVQALDEPLPTAEYDEHRNISLYDLGIEELDKRAINLDQWLATIEVSPTEAQFIKDHLGSYTDGRLRSFLPWASSKRWTGRHLVLFLQFEDYCRLHSYMWENLGGYAEPYALDGFISRDDRYELLAHRSGLPPDRIIDPGWHWEWIRTDPKVLIENGFRSFGSFAVYRSQSSDELVGEPRSELSAQLSARYYYREWPEWLSNQDWYDPKEWHDNLA